MIPRIAEVKAPRWSAVAQLPREDPLLLLRVEQGHPQGAVQEMLGLPHRPSVDVRVDGVLAHLARALWQERGEPRLPS